MGNLTDLFPAPASNSVLETLMGVADGRSVTVPSGTYTFGNVTASQGLSTSYADVTGSSITYTPPAEANYVSYKFSYKSDSWDGNYGSSGIHHIALYLGGTRVARANKSVSGNYSGSHSNNHASFTQNIEFVFDLTANSDDIANGKLAGWTSAKEIKVMARDYSSPYYRATIHTNIWRDSSGASGEFTYYQPIIKITAFK
tara:strand:- start:2739 stop:3338 length:600 start_codon:yes stop_codon:yes gene_type:complete